LLDSNLRISKRVTVGPSIGKDKLKKLADKGFKTIVNLSRSGEISQVMKPAEEAEIAKELGLEYLHLPVSMSTIKDQHIADFCQHMKTLEGPVFVHCSMGQRSLPLTMIYHALTKKWSAAQVFSKTEDMGVEWKAPFMKTLVESYIRRHSAIA
jgi:uncharacterized protein (TIGR01244 family)